MTPAEIFANSYQWLLYKLGIKVICHDQCVHEFLSDNFMIPRVDTHSEACLRVQINNLKLRRGNNELLRSHSYYNTLERRGLDVRRQRVISFRTMSCFRHCHDSLIGQVCVALAAQLVRRCRRPSTAYLPTLAYVYRPRVSN